MTANAVGGLPGLLLTLEGLDSPNIDISNKKFLRRARAENVPPLDLSVKFRETFVGRHWMTVQRETYVLHFRPILLRDSPSASFETGDVETALNRSQSLRHSVRSIRLWGPSGLRVFLQPFMDMCGRLHKLNVEIHEVCGNGLCVYASHPHSLFHVDLSMFSVTQEERPAKRLRCEHQPHLCHFDRHSAIVCMFGRGDKQLGKFMVDKAKALGIPSGPLYGKLKNGSPVTLEDGRVIEPAEVCEPSTRGIPFIILNCQQAWELDALIARLESAGLGEVVCSETSSLDSSESAVEGIPSKDLSQLVSFLSFSEILIIDISFRSLLDTPQHNRLISLLSVGAQRKVQHYHLQAATNTPPTTYYPFVASQALNIILHEFVPCLHVRPFLYPLTDTDAPGFLDKLFLLPQLQWKSDGLATSLKIATQERVTKLKARLPAVSINSPDQSINYSEESEFPHLLLLGTGAAQPSKYRNVSASIIRLNAESSILLDCGEGTTSQLLWSCSSVSEGRALVASVSVIFISHKHADHHVGLLTLLHARQTMGLETTIVAPAEMETWLRQIFLNIKFKPCEKFVSNPGVVFKDDQTEVSLETTDVMHITTRSNDFRIPAGSFGVKLYISLCTESRTVSLCYSGDLMPDLVWTDFVRDCDCLLHEATFEDELENEAKKRLHCTTGDALNVALESSTPLLVLTHFSQRYPSIPKVSTLEDCNSTLFCTAFGLDFTRVPLRQLFEIDPIVRKRKLNELDAEYNRIKQVLDDLNSTLAAVEVSSTEDL
eukprot:Gregarina_sp_Poly_1__2743@NODE_175_length_12037_cov_139_596324_g155_i0_p1_GENE_NODE_175_length_12037_cov_139_596324_g155_i0NODE_175_length_12037_cov_139_596324_g155_i0_p1_ORF_typecomplete_len772_score102_04Lactamase_B_2/PF12706_7/1_6e03Lactamase_B_2/PF12706_7/2_7e28Lactamase_B/PF00753_27/7_5e08Lactamase_B_6/PF16661_5/6_5e05Lactamase_B_6/PF16661_5/1_1e03Lactamase_B_3/PF13483_6/0_2_NODE_175_length_12037_cov_139_596324_g155_i056727987